MLLTVENRVRRPSVLHIGDPIRYNPETLAALEAACDVFRPSAAERERPEFVRALKERRWGDFDAIMRPFWWTGGEMGQWDEELIGLLPSTVKVFASAGAGFDWADVQKLGERGIIYCNGGPACKESVADFTVAMIISTFRHLPWCIMAGSSGSESAFRLCHVFANHVSHTLAGRALGLVGFGNIGQAVAGRCGRGFDMRIHYFDIQRKPAAVEAELGAAFHDSLESLVRASDCVVLCAPALNGAGQRVGGGEPMMAAREFAWFRPEARFVNVARGSMVDYEALADALEERRIGGAAVDVHAAEPGVNERLRKMAVADGRVMLTCHNGGGTVETHQGFEELSMRNVMAVLAGGKPLTPVNLEFLQSK